MGCVSVSKEPNPLDDSSITFTQRQAMLEKEQDAIKKREKEKKHSAYTRWTQFNNDATEEMMSLALENPKAMAVLFFLVDQMDSYNAVVCSRVLLSEALGCSERTISSAVKCLKDKGFIRILKSGTTNVYTVNDKVWWKSWGSNHKYSKFSANVLVSETEQNEDYNTKFNAEKINVVKKYIKESKNRKFDLNTGINLDNLDPEDVIDE